MTAEEIFEKTYTAYGPALYRFCLVQMKHPADAEDILQEVFCKRLYQAPGFKSPEHERNWLFRVALNLCRDQWRRSRRSELPLEAAAGVSLLEDAGQGHRRIHMAGGAAAGKQNVHNYTSSFNLFWVPVSDVKCSKPSQSPPAESSGRCPRS